MNLLTSPVDRLCRDFELLVPLVRWLNCALSYQLNHKSSFV